MVLKSLCYIKNMAKKNNTVYNKEILDLLN